MLSYFYAFVKRYFTMSIESFHKETDLEETLGHHIVRDTETAIANTMFDMAWDLELLDDDSEVPIIESAICWIAGVGMSGKRVPRA
jgi:hypothetical protein